VIGNILAMPMVGIVVMPAALVSYFMMPVGLEEWPLRVMGWGVRVMLDISHMIAQWPEADFGMQSWPLSALISFTLGGLILIIVRGPARWAFIFPVFAGTILVATYKMPDMLVSNTGKLVLARVEKDGVILNTRRTEKFHAENWIAAYGLRPEQVEVLPREGKIVGELGIVITCDPGSCHYRFPNGAVIAIAVTPRAAMEDCGKVDVLISKEPIKRQCRKGQVIDKWDLRRDGTHAIYADGNTITIKTVAQTRGQRPWTLSN
jgi:competence protein ComEC